MRIDKHHGKRILIRLLGTLLFTTIICTVSDCHAQRQQARFMRGARIQNGPRHLATRQQHDQLHSHPASPVQDDRTVTRRYNSHNLNDSIPTEPFPKYIGGFHSSHFNNVGVPPGDIGFRGNGLYWTPW